MAVDNGTGASKTVKRGILAWVLSLEDVCTVAISNELEFESVTEMPANNVSVVFRKSR